MHQFRVAQLLVLSAFAVFVRAAMARMSQLIDFDEPWHGPIANYTTLTVRYPVINVLAMLDGVFLLVTAMAVALGATALSMRRWRASSVPTVVAGAALGLAGLAFGGWGFLIAVLDQDIAWSAIVGALAGLGAAIAAAYAYRSAASITRRRESRSGSLQPGVA